MNNIYIPTTSPEDWRQLLADPIKHWRSGYSARALVESWENASGLPDEIQSLLEDADDPQLHNLEMLLAIPEYQVALPGGSRPSQNDLFVLARTGDNRLAVIMVEGKVNEPFGPTLGEWLQNASPGKMKRLAFLCDQLEISPQHIPPTIRYQLLHRTVSAVLMARRFTARYAMMIVHSFSQEHRWLEDYEAFLELFAVRGRINTLTFLATITDIQLFAGWAAGEAQEDRS